MIVWCAPGGGLFELGLLSCCSLAAGFSDPAAGVDAGSASGSACGAVFSWTSAGASASAGAASASAGSVFDVGDAVADIVMSLMSATRAG